MLFFPNPQIECSALGTKRICTVGINLQTNPPLGDSIDPSKTTLYKVSRVLSGFLFQDHGESNMANPSITYVKIIAL